MAISRALRLWRTVRHLRPVQIYGRFLFRVCRPRPDKSPAGPVRQPEGAWREPARRRASLTAPATFFLLNEAGALADHGWDDPAKSKLWRYNQHYFDDLTAEGAASRKDWHTQLISAWINENPPGEGTGWEPYPTSLRIVNWVKWALAGNELTECARHSLCVQARWLTRRLEYHLLGNHLFANAKALVFAGLYFGGSEADRWLGLGLDILHREISVQILSDGGHFELSPMYHALAVEDMLDLVNVATAFGRSDLANAWADTVQAMLYWLSCMSHPDGGIAFFNDSALGIAPDNEALFSYAQRLGVYHRQVRRAVEYLNETGYVRLSLGSAVLIADMAQIGPHYLPGHAHADTLSFEMSLAERRLIVNSGISVYGLGPERLRQRGTKAHSTVTVDDRDSSEMWSGFRVGRRAKAFDVEVSAGTDLLLAQASHDGYRFLPGRPIHRRAWRLEGSGLRMTDTLEGQGGHRLDLRFHLGQGVSVRSGNEGWLDLIDEGGRQVARLLIEGGAIHVTRGTWHPAFGVSVPNQCISVSAEVSLPHTFLTHIEW